MLTALLATVALTALPTTAAAADDVGVPAPVQVATGWQYAPDPSFKGVAAHWQDGKAGSDWRPVTIPHVFDPRPLKGEFWGTVGWYRLTFRTPDAPGFDWAMRFQQIRRVAHFWLNGRDLGTSSDPYVAFTLPLNGLRAGRLNTLVIRVDNRKHREPREGWWNWGGITRPASLIPLGPVQLRNVGLLPKLRGCYFSSGPCAAQVLFDGVVANRSSGLVRPTIEVTLTPPGGGTATHHTITVRALRPGDTAHVRTPLSVAGTPVLWSPQDPKLYDATVVTRGQGAAAQRDRLRIGLRDITVRKGRLLLNGRPLDLRGASIQEDVPGRGPALTDADIARIIEQLRAVHANVTRAHYLLNERLLDKLDEAGILVWSQAPIYHRDRLLVTRAQRARALATLRGTVLGARNHPSVITHSVANELSVIPDKVPGTREYLDRALNTVRTLDPTRPVSVDLLSYPGYQRQRTYARYDLLGVNSYFGWYPGKQNHPTGRLEDLGPYLERLRRQYPRPAIVLTEFGAESTNDGPSSQKETYAFQTDYVRQVLAIVDRLPFMGGAIYWTLREFAVKPDWDGGAKRAVARDSIHNKGLITYTGRLKPAWQVAEKDFAATPIYLSSRRGPGGGGIGFGGIALMAGLVTLILGLIALDAWALSGILRSAPRRARRGGIRREPEGATAQS